MALETAVSTDSSARARALRSTPVLRGLESKFIIPDSRIPESVLNTVRLGRNGQLSLPRSVMKRLHLQGNETLLLDVSEDGVIQLRPAAVLPIEMYTPERIAEFERESEVDADTRAAARKVADDATR
jgi:antitoxin component of MazEF toxin-antitoxin module